MTTPASRYGAIPYGAYYYGSTGTETVGTYLWALEVDWDGDGVFDGTNEAGRMTDIDITRGRKTFLQPNGQGFYPIQPGNAKITLDNHDGRYDAWNSSSDLYPNVTYGKDVRLKAIDAATGSTYSVFYGVLSDIIPIGYGSTATVKIVVEDGLRFLRDNYATVSYSTAVAVSTAVGSILNSVAWPSRWGRNIDTSADTIPSFELTGSNISADDLKAVSDSFFGQFFVAADGRATYRDKTTFSTSVTTYDESILQKDIGNPLPWIYSRNISKILVSTYSSTSTSTATYNGTGYTTQPRTFKLSATWLQSTATADNNVNVVGAFLVQQHPTPVISVANRPSYQFAELFETLIVNIPTIGIDNVSLKVGGIEHLGTPQNLRTTFWMEPYLSGANFWTWPITNFGTDTIFGW